MLEGLNVEIAHADLARPETLEVALRGAEKVYFVATDPALQLSEKVYTAAQRTGVRHIVRLSGSFLVGLEAPVQLDRWHAQAEQSLERSGIAYTHLRPSCFMQHLLFLGTTGTLALPMGEARQPGRFPRHRRSSRGGPDESGPRGIDVRDHRAGGADVHRGGGETDGGVRANLQLCVGERGRVRAAPQPVGATGVARRRFGQRIRADRGRTPGFWRRD